MKIANGSQAEKKLVIIPFGGHYTLRQSPSSELGKDPCGYEIFLSLLKNPSQVS